MKDEIVSSMKYRIDWLEKLNNSDPRLRRSWFATYVEIKIMLLIGKITRFDSDIKTQQEQRKATKFARKDSCTKTVWITSNLIQEGDVRITSAINNDKQILQESSVFAKHSITAPFQ